jgi:hypothetical protein
VIGDRIVQIVAIAMMLTLVGSSLLARRLPLAQSLRMALAWVLIFAAVMLGYTLLRG